MGSRRYLLGKSLQALVTLWFVLTFNFFLFRVLPGDPVATLARSERLTPDDVARLQHDLGLDLPMAEQYVVYLKNTLTGNLGESLRTGIPVREVIGGRMWPTVLLVGLGTLLAELGRRPDRDPRRVAARQPLRHELAVHLSRPVRDAGGLAGHASVALLLGMAALVPCRRVRERGRDRRRPSGRSARPPVPAAAHAHARLHRGVLDRDALLDDRHDQRRFRADRPRERRAGPARAPEARRAQRVPADVHAHHPELRVRAGRRDRDRDGVFVARARPAHLPGDPDPRLPGDPGRVPGRERGGDRGEPGRGRHVRIPRSRIKEA